MNNPDEIPEDLSEIEKIAANEAVTPTPGDETPGDEVKGEQTPPAEKVETEAATEEKTEEGEKPAPIKSKDGKHEIPYSVLQTEREKRRAAEESLQELTNRLNELEKKVQTGDTTQQTESRQTEEILDDDDLKAIEEDFPQFGKLIKALKGQISSLESTVTDLRTKDEQREVVAAKSKGDEVQATIEANPTLLYWQSQDPEMFKVAIQYDDVIRADPRNQSLTLAQRFERVVHAVEAVYGKTEVPPEYRKEPEPVTDEVREAAKKAIAAAGSFKPKTLSDMPGGTPPAQTERERIENMSPAQLDAMMQKMSPEELSAFLAKTI
jgi:prefoldin subunit 5